MVKRSLIALMLAAASPIFVSAKTRPASAVQDAANASAAQAQPKASDPATTRSRHHRRHSNSASGKHRRRHHHQTATKQ
jgi:hypothetical protein